MNEIDRLAPSTEKTVLGELLLDPHLALQYVSRLKADYFRTEKLQWAFQGIQDLSGQGREADVLLLTDWLMGHKDMHQERNEVALGLFNLKDAVVTTAYLEEHIELLRRDYVRRKVYQLGGDLQKKAGLLTEDPDSLPEMGMEMLRSLVAERPWEQVFRSQKEVAESAVWQRREYMDRLQEHGFIGIPTGIRKLDETSGGWLGTELIVIGGQTGEGKSWFMVHHIMEAALHGVPCLVYSLEMMSEDLYVREMLTQTSLSSHDWYEKALTQTQEEEVAQTRLKVDGLPITYMDSNRYDVEQLCAMAREQHEKGVCDILFVDYAQIIRASEKLRYDRREMEVKRCVDRLKDLAKELDIPVVLLAQLNRDQMHSTDGKPKKSDLRESGALEQDADRIYLIWRPFLHQAYEVTVHDRIYRSRDYVFYLEVKNRKFGEHIYPVKVNREFTKFLPEEETS